MEFKATASNGVLFWNADSNDYIGIGLVENYVHFTFDLGSGE